MFLLISSVAHETAGVNEEMGKSFVLRLKNGEMICNVLPKKSGGADEIGRLIKKTKLPEEAWQDPETEIYLFSSQGFGEEL